MSLSIFHNARKQFTLHGQVRSFQDSPGSLRLLLARRYSQIIHLILAQRAELILVLLLFIVGLAIRLPNLLLVPRYTDEGVEVQWAVDIALGRRLPLTAVYPFNGPLYSYLLAVLLRVLGFSIVLPRLMVTVFGALTVVATYALGRMMWGRGAGLIAAGLVLTCPTLVILTHFAFFSILTPFFSTVTLGALWAGVTWKNDWLLAASGLLAGLALQAHPLVIFALAGMLLWFLLRRDLGAWLRRPAPYVALALFLLSYSPVLVANLGSAGALLNQAQDRTYAFVPTISLHEYGRRLVQLLQRISMMVGGGFPGPHAVSWPTVIVFGSLLAVSLFFAWRCSRGLIPAVFISSTALLPVIVPNFAQIPGDRYIMFLAPFGFVGFGGLFTGSLNVLARGNWTAKVQYRLRHGAAALILVASTAMMGYSVLSIQGYYDAALASGSTNQEFFRLRDVLRAQGACGERLFLEDVSARPLGEGQAYVTAKAIHSVLTLDGCQHEVGMRPELIDKLSGQSGQAWLVVPKASADKYSVAFNLQAVTSINAFKGVQRGEFALYRIEPR